MQQPLNTKVNSIMLQANLLSYCAFQQHTLGWDIGCTCLLDAQTQAQKQLSFRLGIQTYDILVFQCLQCCYTSLKFVLHIVKRF